MINASTIAKVHVLLGKGFRLCVGKNMFSQDAVQGQYHL